ncbi:hypothetical protein [Streptomyces sp. 7N604]|uniref:hypothetical protein n=1 Tax=Streptomyces sp. 7N604 TaxID=3457415 RepID=UPI003FD25B37
MRLAVAEAEGRARKSAHLPAPGQVWPAPRSPGRCAGGLAGGEALDDAELEPVLLLELQARRLDLPKGSAQKVLAAEREAIRK